MRLKKIFYSYGLLNNLLSKVFKKGLSFNNLYIIYNIPVIFSIFLFIWVFQDPYIDPNFDAGIKLVFIFIVLFYNQKMITFKINRYFEYLDRKIKTFPEKNMSIVDIDFSLRPFRNTNKRLSSMMKKVRTQMKMYQNRFHRLDAELKKGKSKADQYEVLKRDLVANISHELRTPLTNIMGYFQLLKNPNINPAVRSESENVIDQNLQHFSLLINNLLEVSRDRTVQENDFIAIDLSDELKKIITFYNNFYENKKIKIMINLGKECRKIIGEKIRILNIVENLVSNALKFTDTGSITITADVIKRKTNSNKIDLFTHNWSKFMADKTLKFIIKDTGAGINKAKLKKIFEPFQQGDASVTRKFGGTGLGLYLVKKSLEEANGEIQVESKVKVGTKVTFFVPVRLEK